MAILDMKMALDVFEEQHGRLPMTTEVETVRQIAIMVPNLMHLSGHTDDFVRAWEAMNKPEPPPEGFIDWEAYHQAMMTCGNM